MYSDPPYLRSARKSRRRYRHDYGDADHEALLGLLRDLPCAAMVSGYPSALYDELLGGWRSLSLRRARWKIENEAFNVLKQHGCQLEHSFGHGRETLASVLVVLNLLAFALHTACDLAEALWQQARQRLGTRCRLFEHLRTVTECQAFPDRSALMTLLATGGTAAQPP